MPKRNDHPRPGQAANPPGLDLDRIRLRLPATSFFSSRYAPRTNQPAPISQHSATAGTRDAIAGDTQLSRRLDQIILPRWKADEEFQELVTAILRSLPIKQPSALSSQSLRHLARVSDGITARVFGILNELAIDAIRCGTERINDEDIESWKPILERETMFA